MSYFSELDIEVSDTIWLVQGDIHGDARAIALPKYYYHSKTNVILLGDAGFNYYLDERDNKTKSLLAKLYPNATFWCVRGNHEARPEDISTMKKVYNEIVNGYVYEEERYPHIKYFMDGEYQIGGYHCLVIGGAYSVDKEYRLMRGWQWFANEQLSQGEMEMIEKEVSNQTYDFIFTHTCPLDWEPTDLFLHMIDQSKVDKSMEKWMNHLKNDCGLTWKHAWCFGHYHGDQAVRPHVDMYYRDSESLKEIEARWKDYDESEELNWWIDKSPNFYMGV